MGNKDLLRVYCDGVSHTKIRRHTGEPTDQLRVGLCRLADPEQIKYKHLYTVEQEMSKQ